MNRSGSGSGRVPVLPISLVILGSLTVVTGVAVPVRLLAVGPATIVTGDVSLVSLPVAVGVALVLAGTVALTFGTLLLSFEGGFL
ncbi:MAG: hypothetical protein V5A31_06220 [Haloferacaceae archaeon]|jgi:hypothetical protein